MFFFLKMHILVCTGSWTLILSQKLQVPQGSLFLPPLNSWLTWRNPRLIIKPQRKLHLLLFIVSVPVVPAQGLKDSPRPTSPAPDLQSRSHFPCRRVVHAKQSCCWTHQIYCVYTESLRVTHPPARAGTCRHPNSAFCQSRDDSYEFVCRQRFRAVPCRQN